MLCLCELAAVRDVPLLQEWARQTRGTHGAVCACCQWTTAGTHSWQGAGSRGGYSQLCLLPYPQHQPATSSELADPTWIGAIRLNINHYEKKKKNTVKECRGEKKDCTAIHAFSHVYLCSYTYWAYLEATSVAWHETFALHHHSVPQTLNDCCELRKKKILPTVFLLLLIHSPLPPAGILTFPNKIHCTFHALSQSSFM